MNYKYRVTLAGIKGFFRVYSVNGNNSLYTFHKQMRSDLEFPADQPILFKALDDNGNVVARYALVDLGAGTVDDISIDKAIKAGARAFVYFYDIAAKKSVIVTLEGECEEKSLVPVLLESKGPIPFEFENGYVAFEDMPDTRRQPRRLHDEDEEIDEEDEEDDDEDDDEEDEDREEEDIIYDENE